MYREILVPAKNQLDTTYPDLLKNENNIKLLEPFKGSKKHHKMQCLKCDHVWTATPISKRQTYKKHGVSGCPACNKARRQDTFNQIRTENLKYLKSKGIEVLTNNYDGRRHLIDHNTYTKLTVKNTNCGHVFECSPSNLLTQGVDCAICGPQKRIAPLTAWSKSNSEQWRKTATEWQKYKSDVEKLTQQTYRKYKKQINPKKLPRGKAGVEGAYHLDHVVPKRFCFENNIPPEICADRTNLQMIGWKENVGSRNHLKGTIPTIFTPYLNLDDLRNQYIDKLQKTFPSPCKKFYRIKQFIATLYNEELNIIIQVIPTGKAYANQKTGAMMQRELQDDSRLFIIFEDELIQQFDLVVNKLSHYCNHNESTRVHARKCNIKLIDSPTKSKFLNTFHIQGNDSSQISYGAITPDGDLIAVMTFTKPRVALGYKDKNRANYEGIWELSRFATDTSIRCPGIASKLLKHFERTHEPIKVISYADARWSVGNLYDKLGFNLEKTNPPDYFYVIDGARKHRWNYRKDILKTKLPTFDPDKTEYQNMVDAGFWRVWDCGTLRYVRTY